MKKKYYVTPVEENNNCNTSKPFFKKRTLKNLQDNYVRVLQIAVILITIGVTESGINYLYMNGIKWPRVGYFAVIDIHRAVLWLAIISTCVILKLMLKRPLDKSSKEKKLTEENLCEVCGRNKGPLYVDAANWVLRSQLKRKREIKKLDVMDFVHSCSFALFFLNCAILMIGNIPQQYQSSLEVYLKVLGVMFDLLLALLFTKTSIDTYEGKLGKSECHCIIEHVYENELAKSGYEFLPGNKDFSVDIGIPTSDGEQPDQAESVSSEDVKIDIDNSDDQVS